MEAIDKLCDFTVSLKVEQRDAVATYGFREEFDFPSLCNCGRNGTRATSSRVGPLSPAEHH